MKPFPPLQRHIKKSWVDISSETSMRVSSKKKYINVYEDLPPGQKCPVTAAKEFFLLA